MCGREFIGGIEELKKLNEEEINQAKSKLVEEVKKEILGAIKDAFKNNRNVSIK